MDRAEYVHKRKAKYMAQVLEEFELRLESHVPEALAGEVQNFKGLVRARMNALALDAVDIFTLGERNGLAQEQLDRLHPTGRP
jgi:hypothetical protein